MIYLPYPIKLRTCSFIFCLSLIVFFELGAQEPKTILVLDPGHGGHDTGAIGWGKVLEKDLVLEICNEVVKLNEQLYSDKIDIYLTRDSDKFIKLSDRGRLAKGLKADMFIAVHCNNMNGNTASKGMEVFVINPSPKYNQENIKKSIGLATDLNNAFTSKLKIKERGVKFQNFQVLRETINHCPSILLETAFISNRIEADYFSDKKNITAIALAIIESVNKYITDGL